MSGELLFGIVCSHLDYFTTNSGFPAVDQNPAFDPNWEAAGCPCWDTDTDEKLLSPLNKFASMHLYGGSHSFDISLWRSMVTSLSRDPFSQHKLGTFLFFFFFFLINWFVLFLNLYLYLYLLFCICCFVFVLFLFLFFFFFCFHFIIFHRR
jgi:hypothetical protein